MLLADKNACLFSLIKMNNKNDVEVTIPLRFGQYIFKMHTLRGNSFVWVYGYREEWIVEFKFEVWHYCLYVMDSGMLEVFIHGWVRIAVEILQVNHGSS